MDRFTALNTFVEAAETRSFTLTGRKLGISSSAVGKAIARRGAPGEPEDLIGHACLHHRWTMTGKLERWALSRDGFDLDLDLPVTATANTMEPLIDMVERGLGLAYVPLFSVRRKIEQGRLATTLDRFTRQVGVFQILWPSGRQRAPKVKALVEYMARHLIVGDSARAGPPTT